MNKIIEPLWRWGALCEALSLAGADGPDVHGISIDSRTAVAGDLFIALTGATGRFRSSHKASHDGHDFVAAAGAAGAAGAMVEHEVAPALPLLEVANTLDGLWQLGRAARARLGGTVIALTGSSGKTTARAFLAAALGCPATRGSLNNLWGVPLSLARTPASSSAAVYEIGSSFPGEIAPLASLVRPQVAVVLNVQQAHIGQFEDVDALRREKLAIATGLEPNGVLVVPDDLELSGTPAHGSRVLFGRSAHSDVQLLGYDPERREGRYRLGAQTVVARVPGGGVHRALTLAAVLACLEATGIDPRRAADLADACLPAGRGNRVAANGVTVIDDSYNANPGSMRAALVQLATEPARGRRLALLGDMRELGAGAEAMHADLADAAARLDGVFCVGPLMSSLFEALPAERRLGRAGDVSEVDPARVSALLEAGDVLLVKGSNLLFWSRDFVSKLLIELKKAR